MLSKLQPLTRLDVTKTYLPPQERYNQYLEEIWQQGWITNNGPIVQKLERNLETYLGVKHLQYVTNGTIALQLAIRAFELTGEIITTPYSYIATTSSILWENCTPVFVDIDGKSLCIDANLIEAQITNKTSAIMATHVYGLPCEVEKIGAIAKRYNLKVIYDGAHAFGVKINGTSIYQYGDVSTASFHATKLFHTIEGGAVITQNSELSEKLFLSKAFGHRAEEYYQVGINGKNSEFHAAMGLCNLPMVDSIIGQRKAIFERYAALLSGLPVRILQIDKNITYNYAYFPVIFETHDDMLKVKAALEQENIFPRRYFYPSLNRLPFREGEACPVSEDISQKVLCLPFYHQLAQQDVQRIALIIRKSL